MQADNELPIDEVSPGLIDFEVTKASALSPALSKTVQMLTALQAPKYEQLAFSI